MNPTKPLPSLWPYAIIGWFILVITFMAAFITWAVRQNMDLVRADYYEEELRYQRQMDRVQRTRSLAPAAKISYDFAAQHILIALPADHAATATGQIHLYRPSDAKLDRHLPLSLGADGRQSFDTHGLPPGLWKVRVQWAVNGDEFFLEQSVTLGPTDI